MRITNIALLLLLPFAADALHLQVAADKGKKDDLKKPEKKPEEKPEKKPEEKPEETGETGDATESGQEMDAAEYFKFQTVVSDVWNVLDTNADGIISEEEWA